MKLFLSSLIVVMCGYANAQIQHNINKIGGVVVDATSDIDSISFDSSSNTMNILFNNGAISVHSISDIVNVAFNYGIGDSSTCGASDVQNPLLSYGSVTDVDGYIYKTIVISSQEWMAENLRTSRYSNGDSILTFSGPTAWWQATSGAYCWYNNDSASYDCPYGKLYNWYAVRDQRNVCPAGWHVPTIQEWTVLQNYISYNGGMLKSSGISYWDSPNAFATDSIGFSALPGGRRGTNGVFSNINTNGYWWCSTPASLIVNTAWGRKLNYNNDAVDQPVENMEFGFSIRCIKD